MKKEIKTRRTDTMTVYEAFTRRVAFEGTSQECWAWIMSQAETVLDDGRIIYREWTDNGDRFIDVGSVYIFNE